ncbi:MAG: hypothetical protein AAB431_04115 [Patescibacteria group bacterium]
MSKQTLDQLIAHLSTTFPETQVDRIARTLGPLFPETGSFAYGAVWNLPKGVIPHVSLLTDRRHLRKVTGYSLASRTITGSPNRFDLEHGLARSVPGYSHRMERLRRSLVIPAIRARDLPGSDDLTDCIERMVETVDFGSSEKADRSLARDNLESLLLTWILCIQVEADLPEHAAALDQLVRSACAGFIPLGFGATKPNVLIMTCA